MKYILIVLVILLLFGTKKLPELGRSVGQSLREFKDATKGLTDDEENKTDR
ncbi:MULTISPECIES: twin-arginine translocase TatA/TatE family subunit [Geobacillus]|uniref:Sec-independent protein translocase protein TatA n=2 Tax=Geobacillus thermodenitrificans TaxID=33940 RepID=A4IJU8_GEOTN|nr:MULTISPECIES: twin-arginine translocase TatA/TatE family subunit [Geobacillus]NNU88547.1 twin-arginine translocase TatA/TatE family subunit [Geobacillus sp. MR]ABO65602.1 Component of the twin-arginine pre-protein translocation pathway [Geobacillus thermodenitrificans NG80-2]ARA97946.1 Sec-independent protein translocase TatA [Geobacillus thermodenitrificans]ARP41262.1 Sec-independent protein translocase protein TatAy [Geobacillus thermodenitrificans]ATO37300.1 Sec-independent protein trans